MNTGNKVPAIRFKGFSGEWICSELGKLLNISSAARVHKNEWADDGVPFFRTSDVVSIYKGQVNKKAYISFELYKELSAKSGCTQKDDILITGGGSIGIPYLITTNNPLYFKDADLLWLKNHTGINGYFLFTFFASPYFRKYINSITHIGTISHYTIEQAKSTPINVSYSDELTKIGNYFQQLDTLISLHQQKHDKLLNLKKSLLKKMFPKQGEKEPEIRFKGFSGEWIYLSLDDASIVSTGFPFDSNDFDESGEYLVVTNGNIQNNLPIVDASIGNRIDVEENSKLNEYILDTGDILVTMDGTVGRVAKVLDKKQILAQRVGRLTAKWESEFLYQLLCRVEFFKTMTLISHGGTIKHISLNEIGSYKSFFPKDIEEQTKIGNFFKQLDELLNQHQVQLDKLNNIKQACLDKMFV